MARALAQLLVDEGIVAPADVERALARQREAGGSLDTALLELGLVSEERLVPLLAHAARLPAAPVTAYQQLDARARRVFPAKVAERHGLAPFALDGRDLSLAAAYPVDVGLLDEISFMLSLQLTAHVGVEWRVRSLIHRLYGSPLAPRLARLAEGLGVPAAEPAAAPAPAAAPPAAPPPEVAPPRPPPLRAFGAEGDEQAEPLAAALAQAAEAFELDWEEDAARTPAAPGSPTAAPPPAPTRPPASAAEPTPRAEPEPSGLPGPPEDRSAPPHWTLEQARQALADATTRDEVVLVAIRYARDFFDFAAAFAVAKDAVVGHDALGAEEGLRDVCRTVAFYASEPGVFANALQSRAPYLGPVGADAAGNVALLEGLGREAPRTSLVYPVVVRDRAVCILYADNAGAPVSGRRLGDLFLLLSVVGAALERIIRARKVKPPPPRAKPQAVSFAPVALDDGPVETGTWAASEPALRPAPPLAEHPAAPQEPSGEVWRDSHQLDAVTDLPADAAMPLLAVEAPLRLGLLPDVGPMEADDSLGLPDVSITEGEPAVPAPAEAAPPVEAGIAPSRTEPAPSEPHGLPQPGVGAGPAPTPSPAAGATSTDWAWPAPEPEAEVAPQPAEVQPAEIEPAAVQPAEVRPAEVEPSAPEPSAEESPAPETFLGEPVPPVEAMFAAPVLAEPGFLETPTRLSARPPVEPVVERFVEQAAPPVIEPAAWPMPQLFSSEEAPLPDPSVSITVELPTRAALADAAAPPDLSDQPPSEPEIPPIEAPAIDSAAPSAEAAPAAGAAQELANEPEPSLWPGTSLTDEPAAPQSPLLAALQEPLPVETTPAEPLPVAPLEAAEIQASAEADETVAAAAAAAVAVLGGAPAASRSPDQPLPGPVAEASPPAEPAGFSPDLTLEKPLARPGEGPRGAAGLVEDFLASARGSEARTTLLGLLTQRAEEVAPLLCARLPGPLDVEPEALARTPVVLQGPVMAAVAALGAAATAPLLRVLSDAAPDRRRAAAALLGLTGDPAALAPLAERCLDAHGSVAEAARQALVPHRLEAALRPPLEKLRRALLSGLADRSAAAARAIGALRDAESIPLLIQALEGSDAVTAGATADALAAITLQRLGPAPRAWLLWWKLNRGRPRRDWLFGALSAAERDTRLQAAIELREAAPSPVNYSADMPEAERQEAARAWAAWFERNGYRA